MLGRRLVTDTSMFFEIKTKAPDTALSPSGLALHSRACVPPTQQASKTLHSGDAKRHESARAVHSHTLFTHLGRTQNHALGGAHCARVEVGAAIGCREAARVGLCLGALPGHCSAVGARGRDGLPDAGFARSRVERWHRLQYLAVLLPGSLQRSLGRVCHHCLLVHWQLGAGTCVARSDGQPEQGV